MKINLNEEKYNAKEIKIFNNGKAGIVENLGWKVEKKAPDAKENAPDYSFVLVDETGAEVNRAVYYLTPEDEGNETKFTGRMSEMKHYIHTIFGKDFQIPEFETSKEVIDWTMREVAKAANTSNVKLRAAINYGTSNYPSKYLRVKFFVPFIESMVVSKEDSKLRLGTDELLEPLKEDNFGSATSANVTKEADDWLSS